MSPSHWAKKQNKQEILKLILDSGGAPLGDGRRPNQNRKVKPAAAEAEIKARENERKIPRRYMLTALREGGYYTPMTEAEFADFKRQNPQIAKYFEVDEEGEDVTPLSEL